MKCNNKLYLKEDKGYDTTFLHDVEEIILILADENKKMELAINEAESRLQELEARVTRIEKYLFGSAREKEQYHLEELNKRISARKQKAKVDDDDFGLGALNDMDFGDFELELSDEMREKYAALLPEEERPHKREVE